MGTKISNDPEWRSFGCKTKFTKVCLKFTADIRTYSSLKYSFQILSRIKLLFIGRENFQWSQMFWMWDQSLQKLSPIWNYFNSNFKRFPRRSTLLAEWGSKYPLLFFFHLIYNCISWIGINSTMNSFAAASNRLQSNTNLPLRSKWKPDTQYTGAKRDNNFSYSRTICFALVGLLCNGEHERMDGHQVMLTLEHHQRECGGLRTRTLDMGRSATRYAFMGLYCVCIMWWWLVIVARRSINKDSFATK